MNAVADALAELSSESIRRVLQWAGQFYQVRGAAAPLTQRSGNGSVETGAGTVQTFDDVATLFDSANPQTASDKALVVGYWHQVLQGADDLDGYYLNKDLKHLGHPSSNITRDLDSLIARRHVMQVRKAGSTKQARKKYKLTREGIKAVERMLSGAIQEGSDEK